MDVLLTTIFSNPTNNNRMRGVSASGGWTIHYPTGEQTSVFDSAERYRDRGTDMIVIGGINYGTGSSRVMAASGPAELGVRAVIAESFAAIHRSNLWQWGIAALTFQAGHNVESLELDGSEVWNIPVDQITVDTKKLEATFQRLIGGDPVRVVLIVELQSDQELDFFLHGGAVRKQMRELAAEA